MAYTTYTEAQLKAMGIKNPKLMMQRAKEAEKALCSLGRMGLTMFGASGGPELRVIAGDISNDCRSVAVHLSGFAADGGDGGDTDYRHDEFFASIAALDDEEEETPDA